METLKQIIQKLQGDPYEILNTPNDADFTLLKKNYRALALKYHPDRNKQQQATDQFIKINRAYEFLEIQANRKIYADHIKAIQEQKKRIQAMGMERRMLIQNLKRREEEKVRSKNEMQAQIKKRKEFYDKKMQEQQEREQLIEQIRQEMNPQQFYQQLGSIVIKWEKGLSFTKRMLQAAFSEYGQINDIKIQAPRRKATIVFNSIEKASEVIQVFKHPLIQIELKIRGEKRAKLLSVLRERKSQVNLSLSTENINRLKDIMNRNSNLYFKNFHSTQ